MLRRSYTIKVTGWAVRLWQVVAILSALGLGLPDAWRALHVALVEHVACPYDGALVHLEEQPPAADVHARAKERQKSFISEHHHHRCSADDCYQQPSPIPSVTEPAPGATLASDPPEHPAPRLAWSRSVLSYAPKLPPPSDASVDGPRDATFALVHR